MAWATSLKLPTRDKFVLIMMSNYADELGKCWPSMNRLCDDTGMGKDSIIRAIKALEEIGLLKVERRMVEGVNLPNIYHLQMQGVVAQSDQGVVAQSEEGSRSERVKPIIEPIKDSILAFDEFWKRYPRKTAKEGARKAWVAATKRASVDEIMTGLSRYTFSADAQFIPHPATWLNQHRWADETASSSIDEPRKELTHEEQLERSRRFWATYEGDQQ